MDRHIGSGDGQWHWVLGAVHGQKGEDWLGRESEGWELRAGRELGWAS